MLDFTQGLSPVTMSSPIAGFTSWANRRSSSVSTLPEQRQQQQQDVPEPSTSPFSVHAMPIAQPQGHKLSSSIGSIPGQREPTRSFIHGSVRDNLGKMLQEPGRMLSPSSIG